MSGNDPNDINNSRWVKREGRLSPLDEMIDAARDGTLRPKRNLRVPSVPYTPEPPKKSLASYARDVAQGFKDTSSYVSSNATIFMLDSRVILPDEQTAANVAAVLDGFVKRDIAQRYGLQTTFIERSVRSTFKRTEQGVTFSYKSDDYQYLQGIRWDLIISHIKDQSPNSPAGGRS